MKTSMLNPVETLSLAVLSCASVRRSTVDQEDLEPCWKSDKGHISWVDQQAHYLQVFQRLIGQQFLVIDLLPTFLNTGADEIFQQWRTRFLQNVLKSSASVCESSGSQFSRITTGIQSRPDVFDKSKLVMTHSQLGSYMNLMQFRVSHKRKQR